MARTKKELLPMDAVIAGYLRDAVEESGLAYRQISAATGMSANRIGTILRQSPPPATVGELGVLAALLGTSASELVERAEAEQLRAVEHDTADLPSNVVPLRKADDSTPDEITKDEAQRLLLERHAAHNQDGRDAEAEADEHP